MQPILWWAVHQLAALLEAVRACQLHRYIISVPIVVPIDNDIRETPYSQD
jgi:hypothetical protein